MRFGTPGRKRRGDSPPLFVSRETPAPPRRRRVQGCGGDGGRWRAVRRKAAAQGCGRAGGPDAVRGCGAGLSGHGGPDAVRQGRLPLPFPQAPALLPRRGAGQSLRKARPLFPLPFLPLCARRHPFFSPPLGTGPRPAGTLRRPGGGVSSARGVTASSGLKTTCRCWMPRARSSLRITRASGQPKVLEISATWSRVGSSLLPVPRAIISGIPRRRAVSARSSLQDTRSMASTM